MPRPGAASPVHTKNSGSRIFKRNAFWEMRDDTLFRQPQIIIAKPL